MSSNTVTLNTGVQLDFKVSQSESTKQGAAEVAFYQTARLSVSIFNRNDEELEHLTSIDVLATDPLPNVEAIAQELSSSLKYRLPYCMINQEALSTTSQHALQLLTQEYQHLSRDPIPENKLPLQARVIEQLIR